METICCGPTPGWPGVICGRGIPCKGSSPCLILGNTRDKTVDFSPAHTGWLIGLRCGDMLAVGGCDLQPSSELHEAVALRLQKDVRGLWRSIPRHRSTWAGAAKGRGGQGAMRIAARWTFACLVFRGTVR